MAKSKISQNKFIKFIEPDNSLQDFLFKYNDAKTLKKKVLDLLGSDCTKTGTVANS